MPGPMSARAHTRGSRGPARAGVSKAHDSGDLGGDLGPPLYEEDLEYLEREECQSERQIERYRAAEQRGANTSDCSIPFAVRILNVVLDAADLAVLWTEPTGKYPVTNAWTPDRRYAI